MKKPVSRRKFIQHSLVAGAALSMPFSFISMGKNRGAAHAAEATPPKVVIVTIDSLDPRYLELKRNGERGGYPGNRLMPNVVDFLEEGSWFTDALCHMPSATDMNHVNAVAGTHTGENAINFVSFQFFDWNRDGTPNMKAPSLSFARDSDGTPTDTLFAAWKRKWPGSRTFYASGKSWVADIFNVPGSGVDRFLTGPNHPDYVSAPPEGHKFYDPPTDPDRDTDPESRTQKLWSKIAFERTPEAFPPDEWLVASTLKMLARERPDFGVVLMAQTDDLQHGLGTAHTPEEFENIWMPLEGRVSASVYNREVVREAVLDGMRDVDEQFGKLIRGIRGTAGYEDALIVLYSDHGHITHRNADNLSEIFVKSQFDANEYNRLTNTDIVWVLDQAGLLTDRMREFKDWCPITATSFGAIHFKSLTLLGRRRKAYAAKRALMNHRVWDKYTRRMVCPWWVLDMNDMKNGLAGVAAPGELYNAYYAVNNQSGSLHWPDLYILMKDKWQLPTIAGYAANIGMPLPEWLTNWLAPVNLFLGGHGSTDTQDVIMAFQGPGVASGRRISAPAGQEHRLSDIAVTLAEMYGLTIKSNTVGQDLSSDIQAPVSTRTPLISGIRLFG